MFKLTRISDGQEYIYVNREEFRKIRGNNDEFHFADALSSMLEEMKNVANFIRDNKIIEDLDYFIERYYE